LETADFALGAATWRTLRNVHVFFDSGPLLHFVKTLCHPQNRKYITYCIAVRKGPVLTTGNMTYRKCGVIFSPNISLSLYFMPLPPNSVGKGINVLGCPIVLSIRSFVQSDIVTAMSHEDLKKIEQF